jgi:trans-2,3-dihydro-3-hydroxyanthranilate isomerase
MQRRYVTIDVFTDRAFGGNPLAVVLDAAGLSAARMLAVTREFNYAETTFVLPPADPAHDARVRIFTPGGEIPFAGHPNVGTAVVLARRAGHPAPARMVFEEQAGLVPLDLMVVAGEPVGAELTAPAPFQRGADLPPATIADALGLSADDVTARRHAPTVASVGLPLLFAELATRDALRRATPDGAALKACLSGVSAQGVLLYTCDGSDAEARMFSPLISGLEDPATGSAAVALAALLAAISAEPDTRLSLRISQGVDMGRPSLLRARAIKEGGRLVSAHVGGHAVEMMHGTFSLSRDS